LKEEKVDITSFWFNPNIHPYMEYKSRYEAYKKLMEIENIPTIEIDKYGLIDFTRNVYGRENDRCRYCYESRFDVIAKTAKENGFDAFTSTLFVSPYQKHELLKEVAKEAAEKYEIKFLYRDFRPGFREGQKIARDLGLYMQKYCGCVYSEAERYGIKF
jgi:predicted adenine nucleotide alpha hydrolase (AANH) superfamily ATPase